MDKVSKKVRSEIMSKIKSTGTKSTEVKLRAILIKSGVKGWTLNNDDVHGKPDIVFRKKKKAIFVDGCFWHKCPTCCRIPKSNRTYWLTKINKNRKRDLRVNHELKTMGWKVIRIWEHELKTDRKEKLRKILGAL